MSNQKKDRCGFERIYNLNKKLIFQIAMHYSGNNYHVAQEITQDVFLRLFKNFDTYDDEYLTKWLVTTTKNAAINYMKKAGREIQDENITLTSELHGEEQSAEETIFARMAKEEIKQYGKHILDELYQINERWYDAIIMVYCMDRKQQEVADELGISIEVLHSILYRARKWLRKRYNSGKSMQQYE